MKHYRFLLLLLALLTGMAAEAQFNPNNPDEPGARPWQLTLKTIPSEAGYFSVNQQTNHVAGEQIWISAYSHNGFRFLKWEDEQGNTISTENSINYTMPSANATLVARYEFNPGNPDEPGKATIKRRLTLKANPEGTGHFNLNANSDIAVGEVVNIRAYNYSQYQFSSWTEYGNVVSSSAAFAYTMPDRDVTLVANFEFQPGLPSEPGEPQNEYYNIYGMRVGAVAGQTVSYPLYIENRGTAVNGLQVDVTLPKGFSTDASAMTLADRAGGHTLKATKTDTGAWRITVSGANAIDGVDGQVLTLPIHVPDTATVGCVFNILLSDGKVFKAGGEEQSVTVRDGSLKIVPTGGEVANSPDYVVTDVNVTTTTVQPGGSISLSWKVQNQGNIAGKGGWTERIYLVAPDGRKVSIGSVSHEATELESGATVSRSATIALAQLPGIDGKADVAVTIVPSASTGEAGDLALNNTTQTSGLPITIGKRLVLTIPSAPQQEGEVTTVTCQLARSGNWTQTETYTLKKLKGDNRVTIPETVVIPREQSAAYFYLTLADDDVCNNDSIVSLRVEGNGYEAVEGTLIIRDDELYPLSLTPSASEITEGETFQLTVTLAQPAEQPITVSLTAELPKRFRLPTTVVIPAGQTKASIDVTAIDNEIPDGDVSCAFIAYADGYEPSETIVILKDNDLPVLELTFTPNKVKEGDGPVSITGTLHRLTNTDKKVTVRLSDDSNGGLYFSQRELTLAKGVQQATFSLGPVDNSTVNGDRKYTVTAAVWLSSCSCSANGQAAGNVKAQIEVFDDDGPALSLTSSQATVREGVTTRITVTRNTSTEQALTVYLTSDHDDLLTYNHTVIIPAGQKSAYAEVTPAANDTQNDSQVIVFTAEAEGFSSGTCYLLVTDQTLPDARINSIAADVAEAEIGTKANLTIGVVNEGVAEMPAGVAVKIYRRGEASAIGVIFTSEVIPVGGSLTVAKTVTLPNNVGNYCYYAVVNEQNNMQELTYTNNTSQDVIIKTLSPFDVTISTDKTIYNQGEKVLITGQLTGKKTANAEVDLYIINEGARQVQKVTTDAQGTFYYEWELFALQSGHFVVGACYPGEGSKKEMASFDVYGLRRTENDYVTCDITNGDTYEGSISLINPGILPLSGVKAEVISAPENCNASVFIPSTIDGNQIVNLSYQLQGTEPTEGNNWDEVKVHITTNEGVTLDVSLYFYCRSAKGRILASTNNIVTNMTQGKTCEYILRATNTGRGSTGTITLALPDFIKSLSGNTLPALEQNGTIDIPLTFTPAENMPLNIPVTGHFGINCENGDGAVINFSLTPVSEETGTLLIDVCDENTYYTVEAPHLEGAQVVVRDYGTNAIISQGQTDNAGEYAVILPSGYYNLFVTAENHDSYNSPIYIAPGIETRHTVNLSIESINVNWTVVETEIEDEYEMVTTIKYETNVPTPIVVLDIPNRIYTENLSVGESLIFYATLTNKGLITALNTSLTIPFQTDDLVWEPLAQNEGLEIMPQESVLVPYKVTRTYNTNSSIRRAKSSNNSCRFYARTHSEWKCGRDLKWHEYKVPVQYNICSIYPNDPQIIEESSIENPPIIIAATYQGYSSSYNSPLSPVISFYHCNPYLGCFFKQLTSCAPSFVPIVGCLKSSDDCNKQLVDFTPSWKYNTNCLLTGIACIMDGCTLSAPATGPAAGVCKIVGLVVNGIQCLFNLFTTPCFPNEATKSSRRVTQHSSDEPSYVTATRQASEIAHSELTGFTDVMLEYFGDSIWVKNTTIEEQFEILTELAVNTNEYFTVEEMRKYKPNEITEEQLTIFVERLNNSTRYEQAGVESDNRIHQEIIDEAWEKVGKAEKEAAGKGYVSVGEMLQTVFDDCYNKIVEKDESVCATISLQFDQTMTMTRQAFRGTLTVFNGNEDTAMEDLKLTLIVTNMKTGQVATSYEFQINTESLSGFTGELDLGSGWKLGANETGIARVLFIPTKYAAPSEPVEWSFGGTLSYIDPFTGLEVTRDLYPVTLTVKPSPDLEMTYLMQRDVYGDDPLTEDVVEPMEEAEFALIINNKGYGEANNVRMLTEQPKIIENEKGLLIDFQLVSSQVNGEPATLSFGQSIANNFGTIPAHSQAYAQWWLESSLLGHFTSYEVAARHVTSYGNQDLSLVDTVTIHEMVHGFTPMSNGQYSMGTKKRAWLVNDIVDADDMPDVVYFSDATQQTLNMSTGAISKNSETEYELTVKPRIQGWNYGSVTDPTNGKRKLAKIVRQSDGAELPLDNVWQTDRTLRDGRDWLYENRLHFVGDMQAGGETYLLTFEAAPDNVLEVESFIGVPPEGTLQTTPLNEVTVRFNKPIRTETFTSDDISLRWEGIEQDNTFITINKQNDTDYLLNLSQVNRQDGYYVLTIQTATIADSEGFNGRDGKSASWVQYLQTENPKTYFYVTINDAGYATFYDSQWNYMLPSELKASVVSAAANDKLTYTVLAGNVVPKGVAVMLEATPRQAGTYTLTSTEGGAIYSGINLLRGSDVPTFISLTSGEQAYKLAYGPSGTEWNEVFGWYWGADDGGPFRIEGHKAWLVLPATMSTRGFSVDGDAFGIEDADPSALIHESPVYDLQGRQVNLRRKKGVYVSKGKKMIVK